MRKTLGPPPGDGGAARVIAGGAAARLISLPIAALCTAVTAYLSIRYVGDENYGYVNLVATLFLLVPFADLGLGVVVVNAMSRVTPGKEPTPAEFQTIWRVFIRLTIIAISLSAGVFAIAIFGGWTKILNIPQSLVGANYATASALSIFFAAIPLSVGQRVLAGLGRVAEMTIVTVAAPVVTTIVTGVLIVMSAPPMYLAIGAASGIFASNSILCWRAFRYLGVGIRELRSAAPDSPPDRLAHSAFSFFIVTLGIPVAMQSGRLILAHLSTGSQLSAYSLMAQMYVPVSSIITTGAIALWPAYKHRGDDAPALWMSSLKTLTVFGVAVGAAFGLLSPFVARIISSGEILPTSGLAAGFAGLIVVMAVHQASGLLLTDEEGLRFQAYCVVALAIISVFLSAALANPLGAAGPVLASVIAISLAQLVPGIMRAHKVLGVAAK